MTKPFPRFSWPSAPRTAHRAPRTAEEFEKMMMAIDSEMMRRGISPRQRTIQIGRLLWEGVGWEGRMLVDDSLADTSAFDGEALMAKAQRWYRQIYGDQLKMDSSIGWIPYLLCNSIWKVRLPTVFGTCRFFMDADLSNIGVGGFPRDKSPSLNIITCIEGITDGILARVQTREWITFFSVLSHCIQHYELAKRDAYVQCLVLRESERLSHVGQ